MKNVRLRTGRIKSKPEHGMQSCQESVCMRAQLCLALRDPIDCNLSGSSVHEIFQARILEWVAISFSRGSS